MPSFRSKVFVLLLGLGLAARASAAPPNAAHPAHHHPVPPPATPAASDSLYLLNSVFRDEEGRPFKLASLRGQPALIVMFYGTCKTLCPILIEDARDVDNALSPEERKHLRVVLVTLDPERDTGERLKALASERKLPRPRWTLLRGGASDVRELAMVLGVQYRKLANGDYSHSTVVTLLDTEGRVAARIEGLRQSNADLLRTLRGMLPPEKATKEAPAKK